MPFIPFLWDNFKKNGICVKFFVENLAISSKKEKKYSWIFKNLSQFIQLFNRFKKDTRNKTTQIFMKSYFCSSWWKIFCLLGLAYGGLWRWSCQSLYHQLVRQKNLLHNGAENSFFLSVIHPKNMSWLNPTALQRNINQKILGFQGYITCFKAIYFIG